MKYASYSHSVLKGQNRQVKSKFISPNETQAKYRPQNGAPLMCLSGKPALKVRLAAISKRDGVVSTLDFALTAAAVWAE